MKHYLAIALLLVSSWIHAAIREEAVDYKAGDTPLKGYIVWDDANSAKRPGILVVHEWWGLNGYARLRAHKLAEMGYTAMALDMYGEGKTTEHPNEASAFMQAALDDANAARQRFEAARTLLAKHPTIDGNKIAAIGYCFGGATVLNMARQGVDLKAVVSFHGNLATSTPAAKGSVKASILVLNGADDGFVSPESIAAIDKEMKAAGAHYRFVNYPGAKHGFTNPDADRLGKANNMPIAYNAEADKQSWEAMKQLFTEVFRP